MPQHVVVVPHNPRWKMQFEEEAARIREILGDNLVAIHHIGSTAVEGLQAKPILDILPVVKDLTAVDALREPFEALGYEYLGEYGLPGRRYLRKGGDERTHQLHIYAEDDREEIRRHLAVRDYLRTHEMRAAVYGEMKRDLAIYHPHDIEGYCRGKERFMRELERDALLWQTSKEEWEARRREK